MDHGEEVLVGNVLARFRDLDGAIEIPGEINGRIVVGLEHADASHTAQDRDAEAKTHDSSWGCRRG